MRAGGSLAAAYGDYERGVVLARTASTSGTAIDTSGTAVGTSEVVAGAHRGLGEIARLRGDLAGARRLFELALEGCAIGPAGTGETRSRALVGLGRIAEAEGNTDEARYRHHQALTVALDHRNHPAAADAIEGAAGLALLEGDGERAALLLGVAVAVRGTSIAGDTDVARVATGSQGRIGDGRYAAAFERGAAMTLPEALALLGTAPSGA